MAAEVKSEQTTTSAAWILKASGIERRYIARLEDMPGCKSGKIVEYMAYQSAKDALAQSLPKFESGELAPVKTVYVATNTMLIPAPSAGSTVLGYLQIEFDEKVISRRAIGFDSAGGCAGINLLFPDVDGRTEDGSVLVIGSEYPTLGMDWSTRDMCILFGDAASAFLVSKGSAPYGFQGHTSWTIPDLERCLGGESRQIVSTEDALRTYYEAKRIGQQEIDLYLSGKKQIERTVGLAGYMKGKEVFRMVTGAIFEVMGGFYENQDLNSNGISIEDIDGFILHQANVRMFKALDQRFPGKVPITIQDFGNTSTASQGPPYRKFMETAKPGDYILFGGFGAGLNVGFNLYRIPKN